MALRSEEIEARRSRTFISLTLVEAIIACLIQITLIILVFLGHYGLLPSVTLKIVIVVVLAVVGFGILWNGFERARAIRSLRHHYQKAREQAAAFEASIAAAEASIRI